MTQRNNHPQNATTRPQRPAVALRAAANDASLIALTKFVPLAAALILVLVLITGPISAEFGFV